MPAPAQTAPAKRGVKRTLQMVEDLNNLVFFRNVRTLADIPPVWFWSIFKKMSRCPITDEVCEGMTARSSAPFKHTIDYIAGRRLRRRGAAEGGLRKACALYSVPLSGGHLFQF